MKSPVVKRSIVIAGHKTSVSLEDAFWKGLKEIASGRDATLSELVASIDADRQHGNLSSALRLFVLDFYRNQLSEEIGLQGSAARRDDGGALGRFGLIPLFAPIAFNWEAGLVHAAPSGERSMHRNCPRPS